MSRPANLAAPRRGHRSVRDGCAHPSSWRSRSLLQAVPEQPVAGPPQPMQGSLGLMAGGLMPIEVKLVQVHLLSPVTLHDLQAGI